MDLKKLNVFVKLLTVKILLSVIAMVLVLVASDSMFQRKGSMSPANEEMLRKLKYISVIALIFEVRC
jgi:hypothetical protein